MKSLRTLSAMLMLLILLLSGCNTPLPAATDNPKASAAPAATSEPTAAPTATPAPEATPGQLTAGQFDKGVYTNDFFGISVTIPEDWTIATQDEMTQIYKLSMDYLESINKDTAEKAKLSDQKTIYAFYVSKHPLTNTEGTNPNIQLMFENLGIASLAVPTGKEYCEILIQQFQKANLPYTFKDIIPLTIDGAEFYELPATFNLSGVEGAQLYFCSVMKGYAVTFIVTSFGEEDAAELDEILQTITLR